MAIELKKLKELDYDELLTLAVIESDNDLRDIFTSDVKLSFNILRTLSKENQLNEHIKILLKSIFDQVILPKKELISKYLKLAKDDGKEIKDSTPIEIEEVTEGEVEGVNEPEEGTLAYVPPSEPVAEKPKKAKKEKTLPRRYGRESILKDIEKQDGKATPVQNAMLEVNKLKNIYVNLAARGVKDMLGGTSLLSDEDCRTIISVVTIAERKLEEILKRKK